MHHRAGDKLPLSALIPADQAENRRKASLSTAWVLMTAMETNRSKGNISSEGQKQLEKSLGVMNVASINALLSRILEVRNTSLLEKNNLESWFPWVAEAARSYSA